MRTTPPIRRRPAEPVTTGASVAAYRGLWSAGLLCGTAEPIAELTRLAVTVALPNADAPLALTGVVVACEPLGEDADHDGACYEVALQLTDLPTAGFARVVEQLVAMPIDPIEPVESIEPPSR